MKNDDESIPVTPVDDGKGIHVPTNLTDSEKKALATIERFIKDPPANSRVYTLNPVIAEYLLKKYNLANRPKKPAKITLYSDTMLKQEWRLTGDTIKFSDRQILRDGQNRLMACVKADQPFTTHVVFGIDDTFFSVMDQGKNRGGGDLLAIEKVDNATAMNAAVRWAKLLEEDRVKTRDTLEPPETLRLYNERYHVLQNWMQEAKDVNKAYKHLFSIGFMCAMLWHLARTDQADAVTFANAIISGRFTNKMAAIKKMLTVLSRMHSENNGRVNDVVKAALVIKTWNLFRKGNAGKGQKAFIYDLNDPFPVVE